MTILGVDPGTGASSPTGLAAINPRAFQIYWTKEVTTEQDSCEHHKLYDLSAQVKFEIEKLEQDEDFVVACETFVLKGKSGQLLHRLIGAYICQVEPNNHVEYIFNTTMKKLVSGSGSGDKVDIALGCQYYFRSNPTAVSYLSALIKDQRYDRTDAIGLAIGAFIQLAYLRNNRTDIKIAENFDTPARAAYIDDQRARLNIPLKAKRAKR
jgi:Holliday junction resolvasome RuvABC endonuclease subunit